MKITFECQAQLVENEPIEVTTRSMLVTAHAITTLSQKTQNQQKIKINRKNQKTSKFCRPAKIDIMAPKIGPEISNFWFQSWVQFSMASGSTGTAVQEVRARHFRFSRVP